MEYTFLAPGDQIMPGDEFLDDDRETWLPVPWHFQKCKWSPLFQPMRRPSEKTKCA